MGNFSYIITYNKFLSKINSFDEDWAVNKENLNISSVFGKDTLHIFTKSQVLSGFGAAIGKLKDNEVIKDFGTISEDIDKLILSKDNTSFDAVMNILLCKLDVIKNKAKK